MASVRVVILDPSGAKKTTAEVPDNIESQRLIKALVDRMGLPHIDQNGRPVSYRLAYTRDGNETELTPEQTLSQASIQNDDVMRLYAQMEGGAARSAAGARA